MRRGEKGGGIFDVRGLLELERFWIFEWPLDTGRVENQTITI